MLITETVITVCGTEVVTEVVASIEIDVIDTTGVIYRYIDSDVFIDNPR